MTAIKRELFTEKRFDSASIGVLSAVMHAFEKPGLYRAVVARGDIVIAGFEVLVDPDDGEDQLTIDLDKLRSGKVPTKDRCHGKVASGTYILRTGGVAVFYTSRGAGGYTVEIRGAQPLNNPPLEHDHRTLKPKDIYTLTLLTPGTYRMANTLTSAAGVIEVAAPTRSRGRYIAPPPVHVMCEEEGLEPDSVKTVTGQTIVFVPKTASRIVVEMEGEKDS
jgi:hypothetical protein